MLRSLKLRIITGVILAALALLILFFASPMQFLLATSLLLLAAAFEWSRLMNLEHVALKTLYAVFVLGLALVSQEWVVSTLLQVSLSWWFLALILVLAFPRAQNIWGKSQLIRGAMGALVLVPMFVSANFLFSAQYGGYWLLYLLVLVASGDIGAYFAGTKWGRHKIIPKVSPGKSYEGLAGALVSGAGVSTVASYILPIAPETTLKFILVSVLTVLLSVLGDFFESAMKRNRGVKDSGQILPGHGGVLDRIDSLTVAVPVFTLCALIMGWVN